MKKTFKTLTTLSLLLALLITIKPITPVPQPEDNEPGITVQGDDDKENADNIINCY